MKPLHPYNTPLIALLLVLASALPATAQDSTKKDLLVSIGFYNTNNRIAYVTVHAKTKTGGRFQAVGGMGFRVYLDKDSAAFAAGAITTNEKGDATLTLPPALKDRWNSAATHTFIAVSNGNAIYNPSHTETPVSKALLLIDTGSGRTITATILELKNGVWTPAKGVDIKVAVKRLGSDLPVNDKESFTTDSTGAIEADYKRDGLPGDKTGWIILVAKVEDNDTYGNLRVEKAVPWGGPAMKSDFNFNSRSLWGTHTKDPIWLLIIAYSIFFGVWSTLGYLVFLVIKIKKAGQAA